MEIREATAADAERIGALCAQLGYSATGEQIRTRMAQAAQSAETVVYVAVERSGQVIGWVHAYVRELLLVDPHVEVGGLVVDEEQRRRGAGRRLLEQVEAWARGHGCKRLYVRSNVDREGAHGFYHAIGYELTKSQLVFWQDLAG